ncbi:cation:proton antiporter [Candidatus Nitrosocosmicus franklandus]|uniref:Inner membrane protein YbaL n=1 Tax=Candidatus Nitrosocosmicus franklandianus TaxID=1798806 RepID=A0A484ICU5_9ARCH|nr:cation:proton antiporter [Candidatus Nitrosocosmicus franklandus]VFJ15166.1 Inner membrane protein YbaL [Candidatus Nitrosocosmicus franklandus]
MESQIGQILQDFAVIMIVASAMTLAFYKLKQPMVIGFIVAGIIIGPHTPPFSLIHNLEVLNLFAEMGVILLLFTVGMEFPIQKLKEVGRKAIVIASSEAFGTLAIGFIVAQSLGLGFYDSLFVALAISVTSTVIIMRVLGELKMMKDESATLILGTTIIEDILIISLLAIFQSTGASGEFSLNEIIISVGITIGFIAGVLVVGSKIIPKLIDIVARTNQHDVLIVAAVGLAFTLAFVSFQLGISVAAGAFFAGVLVAESRSHAVTSVLANPVKDIFAALFFVSVGALMDFSLIPQFIVPALILIGVSIGAKFMTVYLAARLQKLSNLTSTRAALGCSSSGGEIALVVAKGGIDVGAANPIILPMIGTMTIITTFIAPYVIKLGWKFTERFAKQHDKMNEKLQHKQEKKSTDVDDGSNTSL